MKKLQIALEYMIIFSFVLVVFLFIFSIVASQRAQSSNSQLYSEEQLVAQSVAAQIDAALQAGNGYVAHVPISTAIGALTYQLLITKSGGVIVNATVGNQALQAFAFSTARDIASDSSYLQANTFYYNLPIANGTLAIQNSFGTICIDYTCPNTSGVAANVSLSSQVVHAATYSNTKMQVSTQSYFTTYPLTVTFWIKYGANPINNEHFLIYKNAEWLITSTEPSSSSWSVYAKPNNGINWECCDAGYGGLSVDKWYQVAVIFTTTSPPTIFVNGQQVATGSHTPPQESTTNPLVIGTATYTPWNGSMANVQIYNTALSSNQIQQSYQTGIEGSPVIPANIVGWWPLNGNTNDYSGNGNDGVVTGSMLFPTVSELFAKVTNQAGYPLANDLVGFASTLGAFVGLNQFASNFTNANGIATALLTQGGNNGQALVKATAYNGNTALTSNLVGWWPLNLGQGNTTYDISGNENSGSLKGGAGWSNPNYVAAFDGNTSYITANSPSTSTNSETHVAWVKLDSLPQSGSYMQVTWQEGGLGGLYINSVGQAQFGVFLGGTFYSLNTGTSLSPGTWYMVSGSYSGSAISVCVNAVCSSTSQSGSISSSTNFFDVGSKDGSSLFYNGKIANTQIYSSALTSQQLLQLYQGGIANPPIDPTNVIGWWPLNGDARDYSGSGNNGTIYGNLKFILSPTNTNPSSGNATGILAATFNGLNSYISTAPPGLGSTGFSATAWVYLKGGATDPGLNCETGIVSNWPNNPNNGFQLNAYTCQGGIAYIQGCCNSGNLAPFPPGIISYSGGHSLPFGTWEFVAITYNASSGLATSYLNSGYASKTINTGLIFSNPSSQLFLGVNGWETVENLNGSVANVQIYNSSLSATQIQAIYAEGLAGVPLHSANLADWWPLNGNANDYSKEGVNGTAANVIYSVQQITAPTQSSMLGGTGVNFNGQNANVLIPSSTSLNPTSQVTLAAWVNENNLNNACSIAGTWDDVDGNLRTYSLYPLQQSAWGSTYHPFAFAISNTGSNYPAAYGPATNFISPHTWYFLTGTFDGTNIKLYVNGALTQTTSAPGAIYTNSKPFLIGQQLECGGIHYFNGSISNVQLYNYALTASQVSQLYQMQTPPSASAVIPLSWYP